MKTMLYPLLTGLLMAACMTSYGQEIVSEFTFQDEYKISDIDITECSDGTLLTGINYYRNDYEESGILVCKTSPEGLLIDSVRIDYGWNLFSLNGETDNFIIPGYLWDEADSTLYFKMAFIDANLNMTNEILTPIFVGIDTDVFNYALEEMFIDPQGNFIISYWTDFEIIDYWTDYAVFHLMRIGLDGTIISESETDELLPPNWSNMHPADSALSYYSQGFGVFNEAPLCYYKMGGYIGTENAHPWPLIAYFFDENLNLTNTTMYDHLAEDTYCDWVGDEHLVPFERNTFKETYLMAAQIHYPGNRYETSLVKYDMNHNILAMTSVEPTSTIGYGSPILTVVADENTIFHTYNSYASAYNIIIGMARLDNDLNVLWNIVLPGGQYNYAYGHCLKVLQNGDVALAFKTYGNSSDRLHLYIIHDDYDSTPETTMPEHPFTFYPNPVKDMLEIDCAEGFEMECATLYDITGRLLTTYEPATCHIDMSFLPAGVYLLNVTTSDGSTYHERIIKEQN